LAGEQRRLAAILVADVVGYSKLIGIDEAETLARLWTLRTEVIEPAIARHAGRLFKSVGDGFLIEFASAVQAVTCATAIQKANAAGPLPLRIGIHVGDVVVQGDDLMGDGVNVAARIEGTAEPGGTVISRQVYDQVRDKIDVEFEDKGEVALKNLARPVHVFTLAGLKTPTPAPALALPDKPSIAVLPFQNMSGDPEQEYFADGVVEEIIMALSRFKSLFVIARNSSFAYKGKSPDIRQVGRELGVRYVLEGSVRKATNRLRITGQLIDAASGSHLWADRFDGDVDDIFDLQDQVTASVVGAIAPKLERAEIERARRKPIGNLDAYDCYLRGIAKIREMTRDAEEEARHLFYRAIELDPGFATPYAMVARCYSRRRAQGWILNQAWEEAEVSRLASRISVIGHDDSLALAIGGFALAFNTGKFEDGAAMADQAVGLNPNLSVAWFLSGHIKMYLGEYDSAIERLLRAVRLSPLDPDVFNAHGALALALMGLGRYAEASSWAEKQFREQPDHLSAACTAAACHALAGRLDQGYKAMERVRQLDPAIRVSNLRDRSGLRRPEHVARYIEGLRKAGLPE
jgi:adenylate cyclase